MGKAAIPAAISAVGGIAAGALQGSGSGGQQTQMSQSQLPGWINGAAQDNWNLAVQAANQLMGPYQGQRVADMTPEMQNLIGQLYGNVGAYTPTFNQATGVTSALTGFNAPNVTPQTLSSTDLAPYMDPYTQSVIDPSMKLLDQQRQQALNQIGAQAAQTGAFGGSRQGVQEGVTNAQSALQAGQLGAQLWSQNFGQAQQAATGDIQRNLQAQQLNQANAQWGAGFQGNMAAQLANLANSQQQNWLTGMQAAMGGQQMLTQQQQAQLDAAMQLYQEQRQQPLDVLAIRQNALSQTPYGQTSYQTGPGPQTNPMLTGLGTASTLAGLLGKFNAFGNNTAAGSGWLY